MMTFGEANAGYLRWLSAHAPLQRADLEEKDRRMAKSFFVFFRGTYFRWAQLWPALDAPLARSPRVLAVGDAHVENFGTWRDREARLVWGFNDFDEVHVAGYANDLARLVASVIAARGEGAMAIKPRAAADAVLEGYEPALRNGGAPFVLESGARWLRTLVTYRLREREPFWVALEDCPRWRGPVPPSARRALERTLPKGATGVHFLRRRSGVGSLGRPRVTMVAQWQGGPIARDAKPIMPASAAWALERRLQPRQASLLTRAVRAADPHLAFRDGWMVRRLAPDVARLALEDLPPQHDETLLLQAMGAELANLHLGSPAMRAAILADLSRRRGNWLRKSAMRLTDALHQDWQGWRR